MFIRLAIVAMFAAPIAGLIAGPIAGDALRDSEWTLVRDGDQYVQLRNRLSGLCVGRVAGDIRSGATAQVVACGAAAHFDMRALPNGEVQFAERQSGLCLGVRGVDRHTPGTDVEFYACQPGGGDPGLDARWRPTPLANGYVRVRNSVSSLCLGVRGIDEHDAGEGVEVYHCSTSPVAAKRP